MCLTVPARRFLVMAHGTCAYKFCTLQVQTFLKRTYNRADKKFYNPATIDCWAVIIFERQQRFTQPQAADMVKTLLAALAAVGEHLQVGKP